MSALEANGVGLALDGHLDSNLLPEPGYRECPDTFGGSWDDHGELGLFSMDIQVASSFYGTSLPLQTFAWPLPISERLFNKEWMTQCQHCHQSLLQAPSQTLQIAY